MHRTPIAQRAACAVLLASSLTMGACGDGASVSEAPSRRVVIVITVDSLRASRVGAYGYARPTTPFLDRFASQSYRFAHAYSTTSWTKPAMVSLFLGRPVHEHLTFLSLPRVEQALTGLEGLSWDREKREGAVGRGMVVPDHLEPFHARLTGFKKAAFLNNPHLSGEFGFNRSWDAYRLYPPKKAREAGGDSRAGRMNRDALRFLDAHPEDDVYLWIHFNDVHYPYGPVRGQRRFFRGDFRRTDFRHHPRRRHHSYVRKGDDDPRTRGLLSALYDAGLRTFDAHVGDLLEGLRERGVFDEALIIVTADHGEEFWEHGAYGHAKNLFGTTSGIPFLMKLPHQDAGHVVEEPVSLIDVAPTVLDFCDATPTDSLPGHSLLPVIREGHRLERPLVIELPRDGYEVALVRSGRKLRLVFDQATLVAHLEGDRGAALQPDQRELYDLVEDPQEEHPLDLCGPRRPCRGARGDSPDRPRGAPEHPLPPRGRVGDGGGRVVPPAAGAPGGPALPPDRRAAEGAGLSVTSARFARVPGHL